LLVSGSDDKTLKIWSKGSSGTFECKSTLDVDAGFRGVQSVSFSPKDNVIAAGCYNGKIHLVDAVAGEVKSTLTGHTDWVTQVEFIDADTVVSSSDDGTTRAWDVATGTQKAEFEGDKFSFTKSSGGDEQTVGAYVVTKKDNLVLVHQTHALTHNEPTAENNHAVAFFRAPGVVQTLECAGDRIAVGCRNGEVLHLQAPWLVDS
jgi:WD40 repeat protein